MLVNTSSNDHERITEPRNCVTETTWDQLSRSGPGPSSWIQTENFVPGSAAIVVIAAKVVQAAVKIHNLKGIVGIFDRGVLNVSPGTVFKYLGFFAERPFRSHRNEYSWSKDLKSKLSLRYVIMAFDCS